MIRIKSQIITYLFDICLALVSNPIALNSTGCAMKMTECMMVEGRGHVPVMYKMGTSPLSCTSDLSITPTIASQPRINLSD